MEILSILEMVHTNYFCDHFFIWQVFRIIISFKTWPIACVKFDTKSIYILN